MMTTRIFHLACIATFAAVKLPAQNLTLIELPENSWYSVPNTKMESVFPNPDPGGVGGPAMVIEAWSGGAYDPVANRVLLWGGGHSDYYGNEVYAFNIDDLSWQRLTDPSKPRLNSESNSDGTPTSRHTYNGLDFISHANRLFGRGGSRAGDGWEVRWTWTFDPSVQSWQSMDAAGNAPGGGLGNAAAYDPMSKRIYFGCNDPNSGLYSYDFDKNSWTKHNSDYFYYRTMAVDPKRGLLVVVGEGETLVYDVKNNNYTKQTWNTNGSSEIAGASNPGLTYDSKDDKIVAWNGAAVYFLNTETRSWTKKNPSGSPGRTSTGIFGRWRYIPTENVFVAISSAEKNVHFYKNTAGPGDIVSSVDSLELNVTEGLPETFRLWQNYPNPFNPVTQIGFELSGRSKVTLAILDLSGKIVETLINEELRQAGFNQVVFDGSRLSTGTYFYQLTIEGSVVATKKMLLIK